MKRCNLLINKQLPDGKWTNTIWPAGWFILVKGEKAIDDRGIDLKNINWAEDDERVWINLSVKKYYYEAN